MQPMPHMLDMLVMLLMLCMLHLHLLTVHQLMLHLHLLTLPQLLPQSTNHLHQHTKHLHLPTMHLLNTQNTLLHLSMLLHTQLKMITPSLNTDTVRKDLVTKFLAHTELIFPMVAFKL